MKEPYTFPAIVAGLSFVFIVWIVFVYVLPEFFKHRKEVRSYPAAGKPGKKNIKKPEDKTLDYLLMPDEMPNFTGPVKIDEHEQAISN